jgi:hypothetical protein
MSMGKVLEARGSWQCGASEHAQTDRHTLLQDCRAANVLQSQRPYNNAHQHKLHANRKGYAGQNHLQIDQI